MKEHNYHNYPLTKLIEDHQHFKALEIANKNLAKIAMDEISKRYADILVEKLGQEQKLSGTVRIDTPDGIQISGEKRKTVKWDTDALMDLARTMTQEEREHYFDITLGMKENIFKALPPGQLKDNLVKARTTNYSDISVTYKTPEEK